MSHYREHFVVEMIPGKFEQKTTAGRGAVIVPMKEHILYKISEENQNSKLPLLDTQLKNALKVKPPQRDGSDVKVVRRREINNLPFLYSRGALASKTARGYQSHRDNLK